MSAPNVISTSALGEEKSLFCCRIILTWLPHYVYEFFKNGVKPEGEDLMGSLENAGLKWTEPLRPDDPGHA